ncbi:hypothetical protein FHG87_017242 [Trinorchestia longiramus]|nr:hypothetical protein FHG87_017242 [Trinorchestia longiramus]
MLPFAAALLGLMIKQPLFSVDSGRTSVISRVYIHSHNSTGAACRVCLLMVGHLRQPPSCFTNVAIVVLRVSPLLFYGSSSSYNSSSSSCGSNSSCNSSCNSSSNSSCNSNSSSSSYNSSSSSSGSNSSCNSSSNSSSTNAAALKELSLPLNTLTYRYSCSHLGGRRAPAVV